MKSHTNIFLKITGVLRSHSLGVMLCAALFLSAVSCNLLDENPRDQADESDVITSTKSLYLSTLGDLYAHFGSDEEGKGIMGTCRGIYDLQTFTSDEAVIPIRGADWYDGHLWARLFLHCWETGEAPIKNAWNYLYRMVIRSNRDLARMERYSYLLSTDDEKLYVSELRAIRAFMYYYLLDMYARVPIVTDSEMLLSDVEQSERSEVFDFVTSELEAVRPFLPMQRSNYVGNFYGRMTRPVVFFLLAKLYLNADVYLDDDWTDGIRPTHPEYYQKCIDYCDSIAGFYPNEYGLEELYSDNFSVSNDRSVENILTIPMDKYQYATQFHYVFRSLHYDHASALGMSGENGPCATPEVLVANKFEQEDQDPRFDLNYWGGMALNSRGAPVFLNDVTPLVYKPWAVKDLLDLTGTPDEKVAGARMRKYGVDPTSRNDGKLINNDIVVFRYADVLLMKAEALIRSGEDGKDLVNRVRSRAGAGARSSCTLDDILEERLIELCWEGHRRQDLVRFGKFGDDRSPLRPQIPGEETGFTTVFPIPADAITVNARLKQNKGYE
ncbi:MAG: RagB/SusD family nutrient uptake outer membrane protein [Bacteroidales bacterium]|nr:RagB/SusD family nutrient uptake outer membrane protein [Bacteroidales bacterium]